MTHPDRIEDYLEHMLQAIERATRYVEPIRSSDELEQSPLIQDAVARNIEIIGEAANHLAQMDPTFPARHPELPWPEMRGMRNKMIHGYFDVEWTTVWGTIKTDLPQLRLQIQALLTQIQRPRG